MNLNRRWNAESICVYLPYEEGWVQHAILGRPWEKLLMLGRHSALYLLVMATTTPPKVSI